jgi:hypothetical protein
MAQAIIGMSIHTILTLILAPIPFYVGIALNETRQYKEGRAV